MKKLIIILMLMGATASAQNPCKDSTYLRLKSKSLTQLTDREYHFFMQKDKECSDIKKETMSIQKTNNAIVLIFVFTTIAALIPLALIK